MRLLIAFSLCFVAAFGAPAAPAAPTGPKVKYHELALESFEFEHPEILPEHPDNMRKDKLKARNALYVTKTRLPNNLLPITYDLRFQPYFPSPGVQYDAARNFTFDGTARLQVEAIVNSDRFILNAYNLTVQSYSVVDIYGNHVNITSTEQDNSKQQLSLITGPNGVVSGEIYFIEIIYTGLINPYTEGGVYYTSYTDPQGAVHYMIATHMEPFSARKVFPGLDEPSYKSRFSITLQYPTSQVALSNMMEPKATDFGDGWSEMVFEQTPKMSSYLIAFAVGPYVNKQFINQHGTLTRAWGWPGTEQYLDFAAQNAGQCLYQLGEWTGIKFPLAKADQLGMPEFLAGAMENWGLIIYKYQYIAYNPTTMTTRDMEAAAKVMCHELAHQWFGDLVTAAWWDDLFLNEGFADYFMTFIQKSVYIEQNDYFDALQVLNELQVGLNADVSPHAHPLVYPDGPAFDDITYNKGASMLRMLSDVMGPFVFQAGIQAYLQKMQYSNAMDIDLLTSLTETAKTNKILDWCGNPLNITEFMQPYLHQTNHPLIRYTNNQVAGGSSYTQEPFLDPSGLNASQWNYKWTIPLKSSSLRDPEPTNLWIPIDGGKCPNKVEKHREEVEKPKKKAVQWEYTSIHSATYGRIIYDDVGFDRILQTIKTDGVPDSVMLQLMADEYAYMNREMRAGRQWSYNRFLNLAMAIFNTESFMINPSYAVFAQAQPVLEEIAKIYRDTIDAELISRMYKKMFQGVYNELIWRDVFSWNTNTFAEVFLPFAVRYDIGDVEYRTMTMFANIKANCSTSLNGTAWCNPYTTNLHKAIYCGAAKYAPATSDFFFQMLHAYNQEVITNPYFYQEYMALLEGMSCTQSSATLKTLIRLFSSSPLNQNTLFGFFKYNPVASDALYNYMMQNPSIVGTNTAFLNAYLSAMTYNWNSYLRSAQFAKLMGSFDLTQEQFPIFQKNLDYISNQWQYRNTEAVQTLQWLYDNVVVIGKTPWVKALQLDVKDLDYKLLINPFIPGSGAYMWWQNMTFTGNAYVTFTLVKPTSTITINAHRLFFDAPEINLVILHPDGSQIQMGLDPKSFKKDYDRGLLSFSTYNNTVLYPQQYRLFMEYTGFIFQNPSEGDSLNTYFGGLNGRKGWIFTTDFEGGPGARSLMPCWDEPSYKGQFEISVKHPTDMIALSNAFETSTVFEIEGWSVTSFEKTERMSTYLIAICVGHFSNLAKVSNIGTLTRMWTWSGMEQYGEFALNVTVGTLEFMSSYMNFDYPLKKLDVMALPEYTQDAGAMENYGLIIGEYSLFMFDPDYATTRQIAEVAETAAHEVVHQWFGDTVTLDWWNDIFLNEGFAQYWFANGINYTYPEQQGYAIDYNRFYMNHIALKYDCTPGIAKPVISDTPPVFGIEPYYKGSALLNLLNNALTPPVFQQGLQNYLTTYGYENASPDDLWVSLSIAAQQNNITDWNGLPLNVADFMKPYTLQTSYPIVILSVRGTSSVQAIQQSCMKDSTVWNVPLFTQDVQGTTFNWMQNDTGREQPAWLRPLPNPYRVDNAGSTSFARINYDDKSWLSIQSTLLNNMNAFSSNTRAMLLDDARFLFDYGYWSFSKYLDLTLYLTNEDSLAPWEQAIGFFTDMLNRFEYQPDLNLVQNYVIQMTQKAYATLQYNTNGIWTNDRIIQLVVDVNNLANNRQTRQVSQSLFNDFLTRCKYSQSGTGKCSGLHPNLRASTYCYGMMQSNNGSDFTTIDQLYQWTVKNGGYLNNDGANLLNALGCVQTQSLAKHLLKQMLTGQYPASLLYSIAIHDQSAMLLFNFLMNNTEDILNAPFDFQDYVNAMFQNWSNDILYSTAANFQDTFDYELLTPAQKSAYKKGLEGIQKNMKWMNDNQADFINWIKKNFNNVE